MILFQRFIILVQLFPEEYGLNVFEKRPDRRTDDKQAEHTVDAVRILSYQLKTTLQDLAKVLFGPGSSSEIFQTLILSHDSLYFTIIHFVIN